MVVQHNIPAINAHRNLGINNKATAKNLEKLSSGYRINRAGDDAAGLAISEKMRGQIRGLAMAEQNAENGISLIQTAEGGLNETHDILQRMRELAVQSSNGTYQDSDRQQIEKEYQALKSEIDRIASYTNYNGIKLLDGTTGGTELSNVSPAERITGSNTDVLALLGVDNAAAVLTTVAAEGTLTATSKEISGEYAIDEIVSGFTKAAEVAATGTDAPTIFKGYDGHLAIALENTGGGWSASFTATGDNASVFDDATIAFVEADGQAIITLKDGTTKVTVDMGAYDEDDVGGDGAELGGYAAGSTINLNVHLVGKDDDGSLEDSRATASMKGETVEYAQEDVTATSITCGSTEFSWNAETEMWDVTGTYTLAEGELSEKVTFTGSLDPKSADPAKFTATLADGSTTTFSVPAAAFKAPAVKDLAAGGFTVDAKGTILNVDAYKYGAPAANSAESARATSMMDKMGLGLTSKFNINAALKNGSAADKVLFDALNNKDAFLITRKSTAPEDRGQYGAATQYETVLQINGKSYIGTASGNGMEFKDEKGTLVATLGNAKQATETGTIRFNTGDVDSKNYKQFLVQKEGAIVGSESVSNLRFQIGANGAEDQQVGMYVFNMSTDNLGNHAKGNFVSESSILTQDASNIAVETLDSAINYVSSQRAELGALQNRLEHTVNNLGVTRENLTAAESSIRDVDMAEEMMNFTKNNILVQASQAMLAQANQLPQGVLQLLR